ncbi:MYB-like transcription factor EOBI [Hibiscus syriacus]|uniref:MYB-like transcription factor EOBI n=1 Tax=Hibiscus syriacus TaxID=106335 RepID=UPI001922DDC4|nr:MYB-like transcription factor EOBI [Hibiscus syriacus]
MGWGAPKQAWKKGPWSPEEDKLLTEYVNFHGEGRWSSVSKSTGIYNSGKSCRLRWVNYSRPGLKRGHITPQEEGIIAELHAIWGNKWSTIARYLPGRTNNEIKNYWITHFKKKERSSQKQQKRKTQMLKLQQQQQPRNKEETATAGDGVPPTELEDPFLSIMSEESASLLDEYLMNEGLWWNPLQVNHTYHHQAGSCNILMSQCKLNRQQLIILTEGRRLASCDRHRHCH